MCLCASTLLLAYHIVWFQACGWGKQSPTISLDFQMGIGTGIISSSIPLITFLIVLSFHYVSAAHAFPNKFVDAHHNIYWLCTYAVSEYVYILYGVGVWCVCSMKKNVTMQKTFWFILILIKPVFSLQRIYRRIIYQNLIYFIHVLFQFDVFFLTTEIPFYKLIHFPSTAILVCYTIIGIAYMEWFSKNL